MAKKTPVETPEQKAQRESVERIATNIQALADAVRGLMKGPLNRRALIVLLASSSGESQRSVTDILSALESLDKDWLNKK